VDQKRKSADALNPLLAFVEFVAHHPVGSPVDASVESFSSHGAYVVADGVRCYVPLRFLGKPAPRSAREVLALGENRSFTVVSIAAGRRGVDLALPGFEPEGVTVTEAPPAKRKVATKKAKATAKTDKAAEKAPAAAKADTKKAATKKAATKKATPKKAAASKAAASKEAVPLKAASSEATPKEAAPSRSETKKAVAKRAAPKKSAAKAAAAKKSAASA
jgi:ribosomal protein S1